LGAVDPDEVVFFFFLAELTSVGVSACAATTVGAVMEAEVFSSVHACACKLAPQSRRAAIATIDPRIIRISSEVGPSASSRSGATSVWQHYDNTIGRRC
jgi:hypothetical protein